MGHKESNQTKQSYPSVFQCHYHLASGLMHEMYNDCTSNRHVSRDKQTVNNQRTSPRPYDDIILLQSTPAIHMVHLFKSNSSLVATSGLRTSSDINQTNTRHITYKFHNSVSEPQPQFCGSKMRLKILCKSLRMLKIASSPHFVPEFRS